MLKNLKIGSKILLVISSLILLLAVSITAVALFNAKQALSKEVLSNLELSLNQRQDQINNYLDSEEDKLIALSELNSIKIAALKSYSDSLTSYLVKIATKDLSTLDYNNQSVSFFIDSDKNIIASGGNRKKKGFKLDHDNVKVFKKYAQEIKDRKKSTYTPKPKYGNIYYSRSNGKMVVNQYLPIVFGSKTGGYCVIQINLEPLIDIAENYSDLGETGEFIIVQESTKGFKYVNALRKDSSEAKSRLKEVNPLGNFFSIIKDAVKGISGKGNTTDYNSNEVIAAWGNLNSNMKLGIIGKVDSKEAYQSVNDLQSLVISISLLIAVVSVVIVFLFTKSISTPLSQLNSVFKELSKGKIFSKSLVSNNKDEIGSMIHSVNDLMNYQRNIVNYATRVGEGDFTVATEIQGQSGELSKALLNMTLSLKDASEKEELRNWSIKGLAQFSEILRSNNDDMLKLGFSVISNLVNYLGINQGGIFVLKEEEDGTQKLELSGSYAYNREKFEKRTLVPGEGLVGQCFLEQEPVYLTEVPEDYVDITSGLGDANPTSILLIPLKVNDEVFGVIELASFNKFEDFQIEFVEKLGESIASTIASVNVAERTRNLLGESTNMSEALKTQEEELRQTMEEMQATQEEMTRNERNLLNQQAALNSSASVMELSSSGEILDVNDYFCSLSGYQKQHVLGKSLTFIKNEAAPADFNNLLNAISSGIRWSGSVNFSSKSGKAMFMEVVLNPVSNDEGGLEKFVFIQYDVTDIKIALDKANSNPKGPSPEELDAALKQINDLKVELEKAKESSSNTPEGAATPEQVQMYQEQIMSLSHELEQAKTSTGHESNNEEAENLKKEVESLNEAINKLKSENSSVSSSNNNELKFAVDNSAMMLEIAPDGKIIGSNSYIQDQSKFTSDQLSAMSLVDLIKEDKASDLQAEILNDAKSNVIWSGEILLKTSGNKAFWVDGSFSPIRNENGELQKVIALMFDISE